MFRGKLAVRLYLNWFAAQLDGYLDGADTLMKVGADLGSMIARVEHEVSPEAALFAEVVARRLLEQAIARRNPAHVLALRLEQAAERGQPYLAAFPDIYLN